MYSEVQALCWLIANEQLRTFRTEPKAPFEIKKSMLEYKLNYQYFLYMVEPNINCNSQKSILDSELRRCSMQKVLKNFEKFTGKHLCQSLFFIKVYITIYY